MLIAPLRPGSALTCIAHPAQPHSARRGFWPNLMCPRAIGRERVACTSLQSPSQSAFDRRVQFASEPGVTANAPRRREARERSFRHLGTANVAPPRARRSASANAVASARSRSRSARGRRGPKGLERGGPSRLACARARPPARRAAAHRQPSACPPSAPRSNSARSGRPPLAPVPTVSSRDARVLEGVS